MCRYHAGNLNPFRTQEEVHYLTMAARDANNPLLAKKALVLLRMNADFPDGTIPTFEERIIRTKAELQVSKSYIVLCLRTFNAGGMKEIQSTYGDASEDVSGNKEVKSPGPGNEQGEETQSPGLVNGQGEEAASPEAVNEQGEETQSSGLVSGQGENTESPEAVNEQGEETQSSELVNGHGENTESSETVNEQGEETESSEAVNEQGKEVESPEPVNEQGEKQTHQEPRIIPTNQEPTENAYHKAFCDIDASHRDQGVKIVHGLLDAQTKGFIDELQMAELSKQVDALENQIGPSILFGIISLPVELRSLASSAVEVLGKYREGWQNIEKGGFLLSRLTVSVLMTYLTSFLREDTERFALGMVMSFLPADDWNVSEICRYLGCGKNRVERGFKEYCTMDFNYGEGRTRQPGAGGPSVQDTTSEVLGAAVAAVMLGMSTVDTQTKNATEPIQSSEDTQEEMTINDGMADNNTDAEKKPENAASPEYTFESLSESTKGLEEVTANAKELLELARPYAEKRTEILYIDQMQYQLTSSLGFIKNSLENNRPCLCQELAGQEEGKDTGIVLNLKEEMVKLYKIDLAGCALDNMQKKLRNVCTQLVRIFAPSDSKDKKHDQIKEAMAQVPKGMWAKKFVREKIACINAQKSAIRLASAVLSALKTSTGKDFQGKTTDLVSSLKNIDLIGFYSTALDSLHSVIAGLEKSREKGYVKKALAYLRNVEKTLSEEVNNEQLKSEDPNLRIALLILLIYVVSKVMKWEKSIKSDITSDSLRQICAEATYKTFQDAYEYWLGDYRDAVKRLTATQASTPAKEGQNAPNQEDQEESQSASAQGSSVHDKENAGEYPLPSGEEAKEEWDKRKEAILKLIDELRKIFLAGADAKREKKYTQKDSIPEALDYLEDLRKNIEELDEQARQTTDAFVLMTLANLASTLRIRMDQKLAGIKCKDGPISYTIANTAASSILTRFKKTIEMDFEEYKQEVERRDKEGNAYQAQCQEFQIKEADMVHKMFFSEGHITPLELCEIVATFLANGDNPLDPMTWIDYIINTAGSRDLFGDATDEKKYCNINRSRLQHAYHYLTGLTFSENALYDILTGPMGFSKRQCPKLEQHGAPHALKYVQLDNIAEALKDVDMSTVLVLSIDTKALLKLGRMKTPGGVFMCAPGTLVPVCDHDFPFKLIEIYGDVMCSLFKEDEWESWKNEDAVIHPVCAYCLNDNSAYMSLVLGKDTAESMCNAILKAVLDKKKTMPNLERVMLLADGGGANMANGVIWTNELKKLADQIRLRIDCFHYPPGASKHNRVEHAIFGPLSRYWKNFLLLTIENVGTHILEMAECYPSISKMTVWLDKRHYKTRDQILKAGGSVATRKWDDKQIISKYEAGSPMRKWNYSVLPRMLVKDEI